MKIQLAALMLLCGFVTTAQQEKSGNFNLDKDYPINLTGKIKLRVSDAQVTITGVPGRTTAHVQISRVISKHGFGWGENFFDVNITTNNGDLDIRETGQGNHVMMVGYYNERYTIDIKAPAGISLDIEGDDGDFNLNSVHGSITVDADDADVTLKGCKGTSFRFDIDDGDITMDEGAGILEVDADDSDVVIRNASFTSIDAQLDDGDFIVETSLSSNGSYTISIQDGMVGLSVLGEGGGKFDIRHDDTRILAGERFKEEERSEDRTRLLLGKGNAIVKINADDGRVRLSSMQ